MMALELLAKKEKRGKYRYNSKGVYTCKSRIKIANFICPTWQLEAEKFYMIMKNYFISKTPKMRVVNTLFFYIPYIVTPSPLRKNRKSGFLSLVFH